MRYLSSNKTSPAGVLRPGTPEDGWLAWSRPARDVFNFVRAADFLLFHRRGEPHGREWLIRRSPSEGRPRPIHQRLATRTSRRRELIISPRRVAWLPREAAFTKATS